MGLAHPGRVTCKNSEVDAHLQCSTSCPLTQYWGQEPPRRVPTISSSAKPSIRGRTAAAHDPGYPLYGWR